VLRKLIPKLQAFSQCIQETPMVRFYSSIYADDESLIGQMSCDSAFHGSPHQTAAAHRMKIDVPAASRSLMAQLDSWRNSFFFWRNPVTRRYLLRLFRWQNLLNTDLIDELFAF